MTLVVTAINPEINISTISSNLIDSMSDKLGVSNSPSKTQDLVNFSLNFKRLLACAFSGYLALATSTFSQSCRESLIFCKAKTVLISLFA